ADDRRGRRRTMPVERKSHLNVEEPMFTGKPHAWIQWNGTDVCADIHCECGCHSHFDGDFMYYVKCPQFGQVWEVGTHITLYKLNAAEVEALAYSSAVQEPQ